MRKIYQYFMVLALAMSFASCSDEFDSDLVRDNRPDVPVTFTGATTYGFNPYYTVSISGTGAIGITMAIPEDAGKKIVSFKKVVAGGTAVLPGDLYDAKVAAYASNVAVNGSSVTFNTTLAEYNSKVATAAKVPTTIAAGAFVERAFLFLVVLDDNTEIVPVQVRIRFVP